MLAAYPLVLTRMLARLITSTTKLLEAVDLGATIGKDQVTRGNKRQRVESDSGTAAA